MKASSMFGTFLKSEDIGTNTPTVQIAEARAEEIGSPKERCLTLYFHGKEKGLVVNKTNSDVLVRLFGDETDGWINQHIQLYVDPNVTFGGKTVSGLRVRAPQAMARPKFRVQPPPPPPVQETAPFEDGPADEDLPF